MAIRRICVSEVTLQTDSITFTDTCPNPTFTPAGPGDECSVVLYNLALDLVGGTLAFSYDAEFEYAFLNQGATFFDFCIITGQSFTINLPAGLTACCGLSPTFTATLTCDTASITTTPTSVSGDLNVTYTIDNLCVPTIICVDDTTCP